MSSFAAEFDCSPNFTPALIDNSIAEMKRLGLNAETVAMKGLTTNQSNSLTKDIVTFETTNINGINVLAPKIYLSLDTRNRLLGNSNSSNSSPLTTNNSPSLATNSTLFAGTDLTINSPTASLLNNGTISSDGNLTLNVASLTSSSKTLTMIAPTITPTTSLTSPTSLATRTLPLTTSFNTTINTNAAIKSLGNLSITATDSINLENTALNSGAKISMNAKDISITNNPSFSLSKAALSQGLTNSLLPVAPSTTSTTFAFTASSTKDDAALARASATFNAVSDISLTSTGSINIANNYLNTGGSIYMTAASDINNSNYTIKAADNVIMSAGNNINNIHKDTGYTAATTTNAAIATTNETRIEAGSMVSLDAGNNINNIGGTIKAGDLLYLTAGNNINNEALVNYKINGSSTNSDGTSITESQALASNANNISSTLVSQGSITAGDSSTGTSGNVVLVAGNDINNKGSNITSTGSTYLEATAGDINVTIAALRNHSEEHWGRKKNGGDRITDTVTNTQSEITAGADLTLTAGNDIEIQAAKLRAATDSSTSDATLNVTAANNLLLTTATDSSFKMESIRNNKTFTFKNTESGNLNTTVLNSEISTGASSSPSSSNVNLSAQNLTYAEYKNGSLEKASSTNTDGSANSGYDAKLAYLKNLDASTSITNPIDEINNHWDHTTRGLNQTGTIVVALTASLATGGALGFGVIGTMAGTAAATASVSATNASMNADGNLLGSLDDIGKTTFKDTTSKESVKNIAVAGVTAGLIKAAGELAKSKVAADAANATNTANTVNNVATTANTASNVASTANAAASTANTANNVATATNAANTASNITSVATSTASTANNVSNSARILTNLTSATTKVGLNVAAYTIANSAINGDSLTESLKQQDSKLLVAQIVGETAAKEIGLAAHTGKIDQPQQLAIHAALGCALSSGAGGSCAAGAAAGATAEYLAGKALNNRASTENAILIGQGMGAAASLLTSAIQNRDDAQTAKNVQLGGFVGNNAVMNNTISIQVHEVTVAAELSETIGLKKLEKDIDTVS